SDVSPLKNLTLLVSLKLHKNQISDISSFSNFRRLVLVDLDANRISDISPLKNLRLIRKLDLDENQISDVSPLKDLGRLEVLDLHDNRISDISPLSPLTNLESLDLDDNRISDVSSLKSLTKLTVLDLDGNQISDVSPLSELRNLMELDLRDNQVSDVSPLKNLINLKVLDLRENQIVVFSPIAGLIANLVEYYMDPLSKSVDVNRDGVVDVIDLALVAANYRNPNFMDSVSSGAHPDVNGDGIVDVEDLVSVAAEIDATAAAPALKKNPVATSPLTAASLTQWIQLAKQLDRQQPYMQKGITTLERLLTALTFTEVLPKETALLANYPNPFNPETWIPYQLAEPAAASISIYAGDGKLVRTLALGHLAAGAYRSKSRAAYWDGRNELGEPVASGVYFYTLTAGGFITTGKMLIQK
ncbi:T9SS type A sorting domain-containing protein, partial [Candidatus Poribacteria bacterium]|nr:T9SS type A sorting domain-containing protein [Candidatus Poribacteria bacterium]